MNNEPVAWMYEDASGTMKMLGNTRLEEWVTKFGCKEILLYTHPAKTVDEGKVCARCGAIAYDPVITQTAKTLTDEEIYEIGKQYLTQYEDGLYDFARAILRKAQEK